MGGGGGGGVILGEVKARPKDIISFSLDYISKSKVQTSNPSSSPIPLDTPARPADFLFVLLEFSAVLTSARGHTPALSPSVHGEHKGLHQMPRSRCMIFYSCLRACMTRIVNVQSNHGQVVAYSAAL